MTNSSFCAILCKRLENTDCFGRIRSPEVPDFRGWFIKTIKKHHRGVAQFGRALRSGLNHRSRRIIFEKSRKPPQTLTFSALPNVEKSSIPRSDHMFDHLQKNPIFLPFRGVAKVVSRIVRDDEIAGSSPVTSTKKQPKTSYFDLFSAVFLYIFHKIGCFQLTTCSPDFGAFCWIFHGFFSILFKIPFLCLLRRKF